MTVSGALSAEARSSVDPAVLFDAHYVPLCRLARVIVGDEHAAEEIVMEAFLRTLVSWRRLRDVERAPAYLQRSVVNLARTAVRRRGVERLALARLQSRAGPGTPVVSDGRADADPVLRAVGALPARQRAAVALRYYADLGDEQIADVLGCSAGTVKSQLAKARASLARALAEEER